MGPGLVDGQEDPGGLDDVLGACAGPGDGGGVALAKHGDLLAVDDLESAEKRYENERLV